MPPTGHKPETQIYPPTKYERLPSTSAHIARKTSYWDNNQLLQLNRYRHSRTTFSVTSVVNGICSDTVTLRAERVWGFMGKISATSNLEQNTQELITH
ncbi:hypothetical protein LOAG_04582 [Loa loa]|uniref:Uncharacterized protein n=1 Tax=Loa loa TaxID=7209 RepID=A0A1I7VYD7_LOALO|nr:hypothetical protein LOAG_04582 [Loa loa]EFO23903.1 hypothetical protein LOAG_04582 [Loa loa]